MKPATDLCLDCQKLSSALSKSGHLTEGEKGHRSKQYVDHLELAKSERTAYNDQITFCRNAFISGLDNIPMHYSFDFAQQIHYPNNPLQPDPAYFLASRKCQLFDILGSLRNCTAGLGWTLWVA
jgi:hypothetical protein